MFKNFIKIILDFRRKQTLWCDIVNKIKHGIQASSGLNIYLIHL